LLLLVDELDQLYRCDPSESKFYQQHLSHLADLAENPEGYVAIVACGSSTSLESLRSTNMVAELAPEFPLIKGATNLNSTKFKSFRVFSGSPVNLEVIAQVLLSDDQEYARKAAFFFGAEARSLQRAEGGETSRQQDGPLLEAIISALLRKNSKLVDRFLERDVKLIIERHPWEAEFQPLEYSEVSRLCEVETDVERKRLLTSLMRLADTSFIWMSGEVYGGVPLLIYPRCMWDVVRHKLNEKPPTGLLETMTDMAQGLRQDLKQYV
jgi:hypothetical protein